MPQLVLEYTDNITHRPNFNELFMSLHVLLNALANAELVSCKSRVKELTEYWIGDGDKKHAFVHLSIALLAGRSQEVKEKIGNQALQLLQNHFQNAYQNHSTQITVQVAEMPTELYFKTTLVNSAIMC